MAMAAKYILALAFTGVLFAGAEGEDEPGASFGRYYEVIWGVDHTAVEDQGIQLILDNSSGSGVQSKQSYLSGYFQMSLKLPKNAAGVVTTFYLKSSEPEGDEVDVEFLGNTPGKPYILQTNVFADGTGDREQRMHLWFDPTEQFHTYKILWNQHQIVFFIDETPIRVYANKERIGAGYPTKPMHVLATIWNGEDWATNGGRTKINWKYSPFTYHSRSFGIDGCPSGPTSMSCYSRQHYWNQKQYERLDHTQEGEYQRVKRKYWIYDYCTDKPRFPRPPPECPQ